MQLAIPLHNAGRTRQGRSWLLSRACSPVWRFRGPAPVKKRLGERRTKPRFDIVGLLVGTVESWPRYSVLNVGPFGALVKATWPFPLGTRLGGTLAIRGRRLPIRAVVRRVARGTDPEGRPWCWVGLEWVDGPIAMDEFVEYVDRDDRAGPEGLNRRKGPRWFAEGRADVEFGLTLSVSILDVSSEGMLFSASMPLDAGVRGRMRTRIGGEDFASDFEVRRSGGPADVRGAWRMGARFGSLDEQSRKGLESLLSRQANGHK